MASRIASRFAADGMLDRIAIGVSALCVMHCLASAAVVALLSTVAGEFVADWVHELGLGIAILLGALALGRGIVKHGYIMPPAIGALGLGIMGGAMTLPHGSGEIVWTMIGVGILALGHDLNRRAVI
ncbi:MerC domain-containing protein [Sphingomonas qomolangmaensis]|uniref:MerC domain-containing protein n=1 Tax=Sphingomonas qomolangmaensis TaxID=2918765 RepID=A0ABY5LAE2_9SPHN|nr:MerC domain-containing protein [Sphingomonas qomolangmaensis]UUL82832.1 MerC domain-containing protein [Sphingomonas qomolangmaensis]